MVNFRLQMITRQRQRLKSFVCVTVVVTLVLVMRVHPCLYWIGLQMRFPKYEGDPNIPPDITVVTAYFDLGRFKKGEHANFHTPAIYSEWASVFEHLENPMVIYTDSKSFEEMFYRIRNKHPNKTKVVNVERMNLWAFDYEARIRSIYSDPTYPKFHPNTVLPEYSCVQHAKYSVVEKSISENYFKTTYFMWLDVGYFRALNRSPNFRLELPPGYNPSRIAMNEVRRRNTLDLTPDEIFKTNTFWVGGGCILGEKQVFLEFIQDYRKALERYLRIGLSNSDQQVVFSMYTEKEKKRYTPRVDIQTYSSHFWGDCWFYLGFQCYKQLV